MRHIRLVDRLVSIAAGLVDRAYLRAADAIQASRPKGPNPHTAFSRAVYAVIRLVALQLRLEDPTPLPQPARPAPKAATRPSPSASPSPWQDAPSPPRARRPGFDLDRCMARFDINRMLLKHSVVEVIAIICRGLGIPADSSLWSDRKTAPTRPAKPPFRLSALATRLLASAAIITDPPWARIPRFRPETHADPPRRQTVWALQSG